MTGAQLGLDFDAPRLVRVTPARLGIWQDCPRRYRLTYLDRPAPVRTGARAGSTLGAVVHLALRALFALPPAERTPQAAARLVDRHWTSEGFRDAEQAHEYRERARGWVAEYALDCAEGGAPEVEAVGLEQWVSVASRRDRRGRPGRPDRPAGRRAGDRRLQDRPRPDRRGRPALPGAWRSTPSAPSTRCGAVVPRWSCTTCPAGRSRRGGTTGRRWPRTSRRRSARPPSSPPRPRISRAAPMRMPASRRSRCRAAGRATSGGTARRVVPRHRRREPWAHLAP